MRKNNLAIVEDNSQEEVAFEAEVLKIRDILMQETLTEEDFERMRDLLMTGHDKDVKKNFKTKNDTVRFIEDRLTMLIYLLGSVK